MSSPSSQNDSLLASENGGLMSHDVPPFTQASTLELLPLFEENCIPEMPELPNRQYLGIFRENDEPSSSFEGVQKPAASPGRNTVLPSLSDNPESDNEFISSEDDVLEELEISDHQNRHLTYGSSIAEHTAFFEKSLSDALDLVALDSSLALQAQLSGLLNDKSKLLVEKQAQILASVQSLKNLHKQYISENQLGVLEKDIEILKQRVGNLKYGQKGSTIFRKKAVPGVVDKYPIEYNQARDKVLERYAE